MKIVTGILALLISSLSIAKEVQVADTGITFQAPDNFGALSQEILDFKWPHKRAPRWVVGNDTGSTTIAFDLKPHDISGAPLKELMSVYVDGFERIVPGVQWKKQEVISLSGREWIYLELTSNAIDTDIYNIVLVTSYGKEMLVFNFNSTKEDFAKYEKTLRSSVNTIKVPASS